MDVHRSRFVPYPSSAISALAFSRSSDSGYSGLVPDLKLALGRANGSLEIWNPLRGVWTQETVFPGDDRSIDGLAWTHDPDEKDGDGQLVLGQHRLFSIASSPAVTEWDLATGQPKRKSTGNFSEVWCFAVQPRWRLQKGQEEEPRSQDIVAGCGDGTLVVLSTADNDLQFKRNLARVSGKKARCMCVTYQDRDVVVAGFADSMIRVYDTRNGKQIRQMSLGVGIPGAPKTALVWQVKSLPNGNLVSGDSNGEVSFWDGRNYSLLQRITGHETDCLDLVTNSDGKTVLSGSLDGRVAVYRQATGDGGRKAWAKNSHRRLHHGEVKAMTAFDSKGMSVVVSGGSDVAPMLTPLREYGKEEVRPLPSLPQDPPVVSAPKARLLVSWWDKDIYIWRIARQSDVESSPELQRPRKLVAKLSLDTPQSIGSVGITADGKLLAASTNTEIKVFQLRKRAGADRLAVRKVETPQHHAGLGARLLAFSPDGRWLAAVTPDNEVHVGRVDEDPTRPKFLMILSKTAELDRRRRKITHQSGYGDYDGTIVRLAFASDSSVLATGDLMGYIDSWVLGGHEDLTAPAVDLAKHDSDKGSSGAGSDSDESDDDDDAMPIFYGQHWTDNPSGHLMPKVDSAPVMTFRPGSPASQSGAGINGNPGIHATRHNPHAHSHALPTGPHRLFVMTAKHQMYEFNVLDGRLSDWSRRNPTATLPDEFVQIRDRAVGAVWDVVAGAEGQERLWLYGSSWIFMLNVGGEFGRTTGEKKRRRRGQDDEEEDEGDVRKRRKAESGAGGRVDAARRSDVGDVVKRYHDGQWSEVALGRGEDEIEEEDDDDDDDDDVGLSLSMVRSSGDDDEQETAVTAQKQARNGGEQRQQQRKWWLTFKYRPILGMVALRGGEEGQQEEARHRPLEVAVVERPLWEVV